MAVDEKQNVKTEQVIRHAKKFLEDKGYVVLNKEGYERLVNNRKSEPQTKQKQSNKMYILMIVLFLIGLIGGYLVRAWMTIPKPGI